MDTSELGAGQNPTPLEKNEKISNIKVYMILEAVDLFPNEWNNEDIKNHIKENIREYINTSDIIIEDIEV